ncbi:MAG TPA: insulinase family protein [Verrucomicrobiae bacterium]|jgi:zinc protease|nr:insulinase family protein [Verrucomicrobiae bacterium]
MKTLKFISQSSRAAAALAGVMVWTTCASADAQPKLVATVEGISEYQLDNGLEVLLFPDSSQSKVTVNMTALVGSRQEGYGETGMAHLLEHMLFKGTPRHPKIPKELQDRGAQFNGSTSSDRVNYFETLAASDDNLEFAIDLEADRMVNSYIKGEDLASEMTVVRNEFESGENSPSGVLNKRITATAYNWHNYGKPTIGNRSDIERVPVENLRAFYKKYYQPDNVVLVVAGKFEVPKALALVEKYFGPIPRPERKLVTTYTEEPPQDGERTVVLRRVGDVGVVGVAYHIPSGPHEDSAPLRVLANILSTEPSGRLYKALVETKKATGASAFAGAEHDPGLFELEAEVPKENSLEEVENLMIATTESLADKGVTAEEVNRAKKQILKARELAAANTSQIAVSLSEWAAQGDWRLYFLNRDRIEQVTPEAVQAVAAKYLLRNNRTVGLFIPSDKSEKVAVPPTPDVASLVADYKGRAAMAQGEIFEATPANIESRVRRLDLPEGIKATLLEKKSRNQEVHLALTLHYGNEENLKGLESAAGFLPELMMRGTQKLTYQQLRDELDSLEATLGTGGGGGRGGRGGGRRGGGGGGGTAGSITFSIQAKHDTLPQVLDLLRQVLREPLLPADQFELLKEERIARLEQAKTEPAMLAPRALQRQLNPYPADDIRYVPTTEESLERLKSTTYAQVAQLYHDYLGSQNGEVTIVGDFDPDPCLANLKESLSGWKAAKPYARIAMPLASDPTCGRQSIDTPDKANATYTAGLIFPVRDDDADYPALVLGNYIFGSGALASRLGDRIRQKEGLSYGVSSSLAASAWDKRATLTITAICNPENMSRVEKAAKEELDRLLKNGVTQEELDQAKQGYLQARKVGRTTDQALAGMLSNLRELDRTMTYEADFDQKIEALTPDAVGAAWRNHIDATKLAVVVAGDFGAKTANAP